MSQDNKERKFPAEVVFRSCYLLAGSSIVEIQLAVTVAHPRSMILTPFG